MAGTSTTAAQESGFTARQYDDAYPPGIERHWWTLARNLFLFASLRRYGVAAAPMLEIGCGKGIAVAALGAAGLDCDGVELAAVEPVASARNRVRTGTDALALPREMRARYATLLLLDVIEHLAHPEDFLRQLQAAFPAVQTVVVTVPAGPELWSNYDDYYGHLRRYDLAALQHLGDALGWAVTDARYFFHSLYPPARLAAALQRPRATRIDAPHGWQIPLHRLVAGLLVAESRWLPGSWPGSSAIACLRLAASAP